MCPARVISFWWISPKKVKTDTYIYLSINFPKKQKRFYKTFNSFYKTSNIVYNVWNIATQPIMHIKLPLQFKFSLRLGGKVRSTENRVIGLLYPSLVCTTMPINDNLANIFTNL